MIAISGSIASYMYRYQIDFYCTSILFSLLAWGRFSYSGPRGTQEARVYTRLKVWTRGEVRGACSRGSKSRKLASNYGICSRRARACRDNANVTIRQFFFFFCCCTTLSYQLSSSAHCDSHGTTAELFLLWRRRTVILRVCVCMPCFLPS